MEDYITVDGEHYIVVEVTERPESPEGYDVLARNLRPRKRPKLPADTESPICSCQPVRLGGGSCGPGSNCLNRLSHFECNPATCPCGEECDNQAMQRQRVPQTRLKYMGEKGWGVLADEDIAPGTFVMEYLGEVIGLEEAERRGALYEAHKLPSTYIMTLSSREVIDATRKGGMARFINHSCAPNCATEKWVVAGELCVGIFAREHIAAGEEVTYDYRLAWNGGRRIKCCCGAEACVGFLGAHARSFREQLEEEAAGRKMWADQDGLHYAMDPALDTYSSEDEAAKKTALEDGSVSLSGAAASTDRAVQHESSRFTRQAKQRRGRPNGKAIGGAKRGRRGSPKRSASGGTADELELDTEFVVGARGAVATCSSSMAAGDWESCAAGRIRLLARMQAHASIQEQHAGMQESTGAGEDAAGVPALTSTAVQESMLALDDLLQVFDDTHARLRKHAEPAA